MLRPILIIALLSGPHAAVARPGSAPPLPFAHVETGLLRACVCGPIRRGSAQVRARGKGSLGRAVSEGVVRSSIRRDRRFARGAAATMLVGVLSDAPWSRYDDCIWGFTGAVAPAHCTDFYSF